MQIKRIIGAFAIAAAGVAGLGTAVASASTDYAHSGVDYAHSSTGYHNGTEDGNKFVPTTIARPYYGVFGLPFLGSPGRH